MFEIKLETIFPIYTDLTLLIIYPRAILNDPKGSMTTYYEYFGLKRTQLRHLDK